MKHYLLIITLLITIFSSCKKQEDPSYSVVYKVSVTNTGTPSYTTIYTAANATQTEGPITSFSWTSQTFMKKTGAHVTLTVDGGSGSGTFSFAIYVEGVLQVSDSFDNPNGPKTITFDLR